MSVPISSTTPQYPLVSNSQDIHSQKQQPANAILKKPQTKLDSAKLDTHKINDATKAQVEKKPINKKSSNKTMIKAGIFSLNFMASLGLTASAFGSSKDDTLGLRFIVQDIITNTFIAAMGIFDSNTTPKKLLETVKETTCYAAPVTVAIPQILKLIPSAVGIPIAAMSAPAMAEATLYGINKLTPQNKGSTKKIKIATQDDKKIATQDDKKIATQDDKKIDKEKQRQEYIKTNLAVSWASIFKTLSFTDTVQGGKDKFAQSIALSTILNTLKTSYTTQRDYKNGTPIRNANIIAPIVFDGVVSQMTANIAHYLNEKKWGNKTDSKTILLQSLVSGAVSSALLYGVKKGFDPVANAVLDIQNKAQETQDKLAGINIDTI